MLPFLRLSQAHLNRFATCPRQFQYVYLDQLAAPVPPRQQERARWGNQFHRLMQQRELGLPIAPLLAAEPLLQRALQALERAAPDLLTSPPGTQREAESRRSLALQGFLLTAVYDLFLAEPQRARILDWKTSLQPRDRQQLAADWQTRLYRFLLVETSAYLPEQVSLTYWFVQVKPQPQALTFSYDRQQHEQTRGDLQALLADIAAAIACYQAGTPLPQVPLQAGHCCHCPFARRCERAEARAAAPPDWRAALAAIAEVAP